MASILKWAGAVSIRPLQRLTRVYKSTATVPLADNQSTVSKPFSEMPGKLGRHSHLVLCTIASACCVYRRQWLACGGFSGLLKLGNGKVGKDSIYTHLFAKYGPILRLRTFGKCVSCHVNILPVSLCPR